MEKISNFNLKFNYHSFSLSIFLICLVLFQSTVLSYESEMLNNVLDTMYICLFSYAFIKELYSIMIKRNKISSSLIFITIYCVILLFSTAYNEIDMLLAIKKCIKLMTICIFVEYYSRESRVKFVFTASIFFKFMIYINFISIIIFPSGMLMIGIYNNIPNWILGYKNSFFWFILPGLVLNEFNKYINGIHFITFSDIFLWTISFFSVAIIGEASATSAFCLIAFFFYMIVFYNHIKVTYAMYICIFVIFIIVSIFLLNNKNFDLFKPIFALFGKNVTLTGRLTIWNLTENFILKQPIIGYGVESIDVVSQKIIGGHSHNIILWVLYQGGLLCLLIHVIYLWNIIIKLKNHWNNYFACILGILLLVLLLSWQFDNCDSVEFYFVLFLIDSSSLFSVHNCTINHFLN